MKVTMYFGKEIESLIQDHLDNGTSVAEQIKEAVKMYVRIKPSFYKNEDMRIVVIGAKANYISSGDVVYPIPPESKELDFE